jgi:outer membrane protein assembly factor BamB
VEGGTVFASWNGSSEFLESPLSVDPGIGDGDEESSLSPDGKVRCRTIESGWILAEKKCARCKRGWRKKWRLRASGSAFARPLVTDRRIFYGTTDNRVYCVKRGNGHRVWVTDVEGRVLRPLELVRVPLPPDPRYIMGIKAVALDLVLVVPDDGASMMALDARNGERVATFELPENETLIGGPLATPHGKIAVARQRYNAQDAALLFFDLEPPPEVPGSEEGVAYNGERSSDAGDDTAPLGRPTSD